MAGDGPTPPTMWRAAGHGPAALMEHEEVLLRQHDAGAVTLVDRSTYRDTARRWRMRWGKGSTAVRAALSVWTQETADEDAACGWTLCAESGSRWRHNSQNPVRLLGLDSHPLRCTHGPPLTDHLDCFGEEIVPTILSTINGLRRLTPFAVVWPTDDPEPRRQTARFRQMSAGVVSMIRVVGDGVAALNEALPADQQIPEGGIRVFRPAGWNVDADLSRFAIEGRDLVRPGSWNRLYETALSWSGFSPGAEDARDLVWDHLLNEPWDDERIAAVSGNGERWLTSVDTGNQQIVRKRLKMAARIMDASNEAVQLAQRTAEDATRRLAEAEAVIALQHRSRRRLATAVMRSRAEASDAVRALRRTSVGEALRQAEEARAERDLYAEELSTAEEELHDLRRRIDWMTARLAEQGESVVLVPEERRGFETFGELLGVARTEFGLVVIGDQVDETAKALEGNQRTPLWLRRSWSALAALHAYATDKAHSNRVRDLKSYVEDRGADLGLSPSLIAHGETEIVTNTERFRAARTFPVPAELSSDGWAYFPAHVRIDRSGGVAPRLHFLDDVGGVTGLIHVGYLGPHLPSPGTN